MYRKDFFSRMARAVSRKAGHPLTFSIAILIIVIWAISGSMFDFSDTWQLVINTGTTIITFLMVFLIQNTQNRDSEAVQIKLDELIRVTEGAHNALLDLEELSDADLIRMQKRYEELAEKARQELQRGKADTGRMEVKPE